LAKGVDTRSDPLAVIPGLALIGLGLMYALGARYLRDRSVRIMQARWYVPALRLLGIVLALGGVGWVVAVGSGWLRP
jgi:hypothetical protein